MPRSVLSPTPADTVGFELLDRKLADDVQSALSAALRAGVVFSEGNTPLKLFRAAVAAAITRIHENARAELFLRFLRDGPYEDGGDFPPELAGKRLSDAETAAVIAFIYGHMVNCFKGALTELLAVAPSQQILRDLQAEKRPPREATLHVGDAVWTAAKEGDGWLKGADMHFLTEQRTGKGAPAVTVGGVVEVKSYFQTAEKLSRQLDQHLVRARRGLRVGDQVYPADRVIIAPGKAKGIARITVVPAQWKLPRSFRFEEKAGRKFLHVDPPVPPATGDTIERVGPDEWRVTLRWSKEALDAAAYNMTFWFMEKVGEALYAGGVPKEWEPMTPAQAGQNAAKQMLYYAILRCPTRRAEQRAIALYNSYGFGCALGMNFRNEAGHREMLWPEDLDEILANGHNKNGCRIM
jgi:hypothetical protein